MKQKKSREKAERRSGERRPVVEGMPAGAEVHEANLQVAARQMYELLTGFDPASLRESLEGDVQRYTQLVNTLTRLSEEALKYEKYRAEVAERKARIAKELEAGRRQGGLSPEMIDRIEQEIKLF